MTVRIARLVKDQHTRVILDLGALEAINLFHLLNDHPDLVTQHGLEDLTRGLHEEFGDTP